MEVAATTCPVRSAKTGSVKARQTPVSREDARLKFSQKLLGLKGGKELVLISRIAAHNALRSQRFSYAELLSLIANLERTREEDIVQVVGISDRTLRRQRGKPETPMPTAVASKTLLIAEVLAKAVEVFGTQAAAEDWLNQPALALDDARPLELLETEQGAELVKDQLIRLEYGVYS